MRYKYVYCPEAIPIMTDNVDNLLKELRRKNHEKKRIVLASGGNTDGGPVAKVSSGEDRKADSIIDEETAAKSGVTKGFNDLHEVASRIKGKK